MTKHTWCPVCNGRILTIAEEAIGMCGKCMAGRKRHAKNFQKKYGINNDKEKEDE